MPRRFVTLDVFTSQKLAGNPLAVVLDSQGLDTAAMQAIAAEFNLSETVFVFPPQQAGHKADLRIFTPNFEMPFAGHPTVGTAVLLALQAGPEIGGKFQFVLMEKVGPIPCRTQVLSASHGRAEFDVAELPRRIGNIGPPEALAAALGIDISDIGFAGASPGLFSAGAAFAIVPMRSVAAVDRAQAIQALWPAAFGMNDRQSVFMLAPTDDRAVYHARMFAFGRNIYEDPATGSASAAAVAMIAASEKPGDGTHRRTIQQGYAMGRPSQIELTFVVKDGALTSASIGGSAIVVSEGMLHL
jgi:trans-2,3-dihydro-3-hydroxyanthranilate isomerase